MSILTLARLLASILSAGILAAAIYLIWSWSEGAWRSGADNELVHVREAWRLWVGGALLTWSLLGRFVLPLLLAKSGGRPTGPVRGQGQMTPGASGSSLYVEQCGRAGAPILLFTHGWGMDSTYWNYAREDLADRFRLVFWDLPGLGRSEAPNGVISLSNFAQDLRGLLDTLDRPAVLIGHSIGGMTIQTLIRDHPQAHARIAGVVLLNTTYTNPLRTMIFAPVLLALQEPILEPLMRLTILAHPLVWFSKWQSYLSGSTHAALRLGFGKFVTRSQLGHAALLATRAPPAIEAKGDLAMLNWDATGALQHLRKPVLVLGGDLDIVTKLEASVAIARHAPAGELRIVEGVNHMGPLERAEVYNEAIAAFALAIEPSATHDIVPRPPPPPKTKADQDAGFGRGEQPPSPAH